MNLISTLTSTSTPLPAKQTSSSHATKFSFSIDRGGTFTDVYAALPQNHLLHISGEKKDVVLKLLSEDPSNYMDAPTEGIRRLLEIYDKSSSIDYSRSLPVNASSIASIRMGTTVATNALLERKGSLTALLITKGFKSLLEIGNQSRPDIFDLAIKKRGGLYKVVVEVDERVMMARKDETEEEAIAEDKVEEKHDATSIYSDVPIDEKYDFPPAFLGPRIKTLTGESIIVLKEPDLTALTIELKKVYDSGIKSVAVALLHSFIYPAHELAIGEICTHIGFKQISLSSTIMPMIKLVSRGQTACASAYLTPSIKLYLSSFLSGFEDNIKSVNIKFMKSDGGLTPVSQLGGHNAILSGPAGGVVGYAKTSYRLTPDQKARGLTIPQACVGFDMGGTSTDVSRYAGKFPHVFESTTAGITIQSPQLDINTVAAGGGSRIYLRGGRLVVGPESVGSHPGPTCYRKGGELAVTDANVVLGRVVSSRFPKIFGPNENEELDRSGAELKFTELLQLSINECAISGASGPQTIEELAYGFLSVANEAMCRPIRNLTQMKGFDIKTHSLACFGGAGPQHACAIAKKLGMKRVLVHRYGGVLSAYGLSLSDAVSEGQEPAADLYGYDKHLSNEDQVAEAAEIIAEREKRFKKLEGEGIQHLVDEGYDVSSIKIERYLNMRFEGTDNAVFTQSVSTSGDNMMPFWDDFGNSFKSHYKLEFGFDLDRDIFVDDYRVRCVVEGAVIPELTCVESIGQPESEGKHDAYFENGWQTVDLFDSEKLLPGHSIEGPCIIIQPISTIVIEIGCVANVTCEGDIEIAVAQLENMEDGKVEEEGKVKEIIEDPIQLSIFGHRFMNIAESMGQTLANTSVSTNIRERLDFSCALFGSDGGLVANAPHIPIHLGAMQSAVRYQLDHWSENGGITEGDVFVSNHPQLAGGSHLPDITVITPVFSDGKIVFFVASRGHHSDIGGIAPGSMPPDSTSLEQEGAMIIAEKLVQNGQFQEERMKRILQAPGDLPNNFGTRNLRDNLSDLRAQVAANNMGIKLVGELIKEYSRDIVLAYMNFIQKNAEVSVREFLKKFAKTNTSVVSAVDYMDDGTPIKLKITIDKETGSATFDFTGTGPQVLGNTNAPPAVTYSAVIYSLRCMVGVEIPLNQGCLAPVTFIIPKYSLLNPSADAAVVGGNVQTSQRLVDVILLAFNACAASQGCMNNLTFGNELFGYYETIAGGHGAGPTWVGKSGVHTHCTNTRITDAEIMERRYPVLLRRFEIREGSGGKGLNSGGCGVVRVIEPLTKLSMSILSERRALAPYGLNGGGDGEKGLNLVKRKQAGGMIVNIGGKRTTNLDVGDLIIINTPGGGGWGKVAKEGQGGENKKRVEEDDEMVGMFTPHGQGSVAGYLSEQLAA